MITHVTTCVGGNAVDAKRIRSDIDSSDDQVFTVVILGSCLFKEFSDVSILFLFFVTLAHGFIDHKTEDLIS